MPLTRFVPYEPYVAGTAAEAASRRFYEILDRRRTVRAFSDRPVSRETIDNLILAAGTAPSGANKQPWRFVAVRDAALKKEIRAAAEAEEREFYFRRANEHWLRDLIAVGTDEHKPFLEIAPYLIVIFAQNFGLNPDGSKFKHYYVTESVGIATGMLIAAIHDAGLVSLTHTPSPMGFLNEILHRPSHERPFLILVAGYPAEDVKVPTIEKKALDEIASFF